MPPYRYSSIPDGTIRLLRLMPHQDEHGIIKCELFNCPLLKSGGTRPYDALSYAWGSNNKSRSVYINKCELRVTANLYAALSQLQDSSFDRVLWVDAICINQVDSNEKGKQVQSMAKIFAQAARVIVWLGEAAAGSDQVLEDIRISAAGKSAKSTIEKTAIITLLQRPWFQRIWVLQEVAAARHVLIKCGRTEIDGYAFCSGLSALRLSYDACPELQALVCSVTYLIRDAGFRPRGAISQTVRFSLDIRPLGELVEMYHTRKATDRHDKIYALLGMSSDDPSVAGLSANYMISWEQLLKQLVNYFFSKGVTVDTWDDREIAIIKGRGCIIGECPPLKEILLGKTDTA